MRCEFSPRTLSSPFDVLNEVGEKEVLEKSFRLLSSSIFTPAHPGRGKGGSRAAGAVVSKAVLGPRLCFLHTLLATPTFPGCVGPFCFSRCVSQVPINSFFLFEIHKKNTSARSSGLLYVCSPPELIYFWLLALLLGQRLDDSFCWFLLGDFRDALGRC